MGALQSVIPADAQRERERLLLSCSALFNEQGNVVIKRFFSFNDNDGGSWGETADYDKSIMITMLLSVVVGGDGIIIVFEQPAATAMLTNELTTRVVYRWV